MRHRAAHPAPFNLDALTPDDVHAAPVVDITPLSTEGCHTICTGTRADTGEKVFLKRAEMQQLATSGPLKALEPIALPVMAKGFPNLDRYQEMTEAALSRVLKGYFTQSGREYSGVVYDEVVGIDPQTQRPQVFLAAPLVENLGSLNELHAREVSNPADAVEGSLMRGMLFGDYDVTFRTHNTMVAQEDGYMSNGQSVRKGQVLHMDFGEGGHPTTSFLGVPFASHSLLNEYPQYIKPAMENILKLDRDQLHKLVEEAGAHQTGWTPEMTQHLTDVLSHNLESMREKWTSKPQWFDPSQSRHPLRQRKAPPIGLTNVLFTAPRALVGFSQMKRSGILHSLPANRDLAQKMVDLLPSWPSSVHTS